MVLTLVCVVCAFFLAYVYTAAEERIKANAQKAIDDAIARLSPNTSEIHEVSVEDGLVYELYDGSGKFIGYAFTAKGQGYQGEIEMLVIADTALAELEGIEVIDSVETPGLGAKINEKDFKKQFSGLNISGQIECIKDTPVGDSQIQAITGATVSSKAVVSILNERVKELKKILN